MHAELLVPANSRVTGTKIWTNPSCTYGGNNHLFRCKTDLPRLRQYRDYTDLSVDSARGGSCSAVAFASHAEELIVSYVSHAY